MKKNISLILILLLIITISKADVIYYPYTESGTAISLECIGSYELPFTKYNTINFWGGIGVVSMFETFKNPAYGAEIAIELRYYFEENTTYDKLNIGLYAGFAYMRHPYFHGVHVGKRVKSVGFVPGLKLSYKLQINSWLIGEPYVGISKPLYGNDFGGIFDKKSYSDPVLIVTFGIRFGFNKVKRKD